MDSLAVNLEVFDDGATAKFTNFERRAEETADKITRAGKRVNFSNGVKADFEIAEQKAAQLAARFDRIGLGDFGKGALFAGAAIGGLTVGVSKFIDVSRAAIDVSIQSQRANRLLAASATEAGLAYADLYEKNRKFAELNSISNTAAASTTARIAQLAKSAGRPQDIDKISIAFSDLGAARGISPKDLETLIGTIQSGQDEGLNRLGLPDPSKIYAAYAKEIGKTVEQLSQMEKVQAAVNAVVEKSEIFKGAAQARMKSLEGSVESLNARWENLTTTISNDFARSYEVHSFLELTSKLVKNLSGDVDELQLKLAKGIKPTDKEIAEAAEANFFSQNASRIGAGFFQFMSGAARVADVFTDQSSFGYFRPFKDSPQKFADASIGLTDEYQQLHREDFLRQKINAQILENANQKKAAEEQKKNLDDVLKKQEEIEASLKRQTELQRVLADPRATLSDLRTGRNNLRNDFFGKNSALFDTDKLKLADDFDKAISSGVQKAFSRTLRSTDKVSDLKRAVAEINSSFDLLPEAKEDLVFSFEQKIKSAVDSGKAKVKELEKTFLSVFDNLAARAGANNPFVAIFSEGDKAIQNLRLNTIGLSKDLVSVFEQMERKQQQIQLFNARLDAGLTAFDLRDSAANFRNINPKDNGLVQKEFFERVVKRASGLNDISGLSDTQKRDFYERNLLAGSFSFNQLTQDSVVSSLARDRRPAEENANLGLQERLQKQFDIIEKLRNTSNLAETGSAADKRIIALTSGVNPNELTTQQRIQAAAAREREADRTEKSEQLAARQRAETLEVQKKIASEITKLREVAEKDGLIGLQVLLKDAETGATRDLTPSPTAQDVVEAFGGALFNRY
jgi:hypothetical protein